MPANRLSPVDVLILAEVARLGKVKSIFALAVDHGVNYEHARNRVARLTAGGLLLAERQTNARGRPLVLSCPVLGSDTHSTMAVASLRRHHHGAK